MKHEIIALEDVQIIGMYKEISFAKGQEESETMYTFAVSNQNK